MKIKKKKQLNLPQLIEWAYHEGSDIRDEKIKSESMTVTFSEIGTPHIETKFHFLQVDELFTVEVEEEITEDTWFSELVIRTIAGDYILQKQGSINDFKHITFNDVEAFYIPNDDLTMTLIWRDGKLVDYV